VSALEATIATGGTNVEYGIKMYDGSIIQSIGLYYVTREYGGPEEGGWYYDHYTLKHSFFIGHMPSAAATAFHDALVAWEESINEGSPSLSSVVSTGRYQVMFEEEPGEFQTTRVPTYD